MTRYETCLKFTLSWEGGFSNHPNDKGGATMRGITQGEYDRYRRQHGWATQSVRNIAGNELQDIYLTYWNGSHAGAFELPLAMVMFDIGVNMGIGRAIKFFQKLRALKEDGSVGPKTLEAMRLVAGLNETEQKHIAKKMLGLRESFYRSIVANNPTQSVFMDGWMNRTNALRELVNA